MESNKKKNTAELVYDMCIAPAKELGLDIWDVVFLKEGADWFLRVYISKPEGVSIDDCVDMTHALNPLLDQADLIKQEYIFEVSSPGINRKLQKPEHFRTSIGEHILVRLIRPMEDGRREFAGTLSEYRDDGSFEVILDDEIAAVFEKKECASVRIDA